jgi:hypothetical protein
MISAALAKKRAAYIYFDESMPLSGHGAAMRHDFAADFGDCIFRFFTQSPAPPPGRMSCPN